MPIYEYVCSKCDAEFERLTLGSAENRKNEVDCPFCGAAEVSKKFSSFAVKSDYVPISAAAGKPAGGGGGCCGGFCGCK